MIYEVENKPKRLSIQLLDKAVSFAVEYLGIVEDLTIQFETLPKHQCGLCDYEPDEVVVFIAKRLSRRETITTLFHEMVHVKQYIDGRLENGTHWLGTDYEGLPYVDLPWEQEAHRLEQEMMEKFEHESLRATT